MENWNLGAVAGPGVLTDRLAAALVRREPGWRLPRRSVLARRYSVSVAEIDSAIGELVRRSLVRRLPDGQLDRASPAEYLIPVERIGGLRTWLDPMVTIRFDDPGTGAPAGLTAVTMKPDRFRVVVETGGPRS